MDYYRKSLLIPINDENEILVQDRRNMTKKFRMDWGYFGGSIEKGETAIQAVIREAEEELTIRLKQEQLVYIGRFDDYFKEEAKIERDVFLWFMGNTRVKDLILKEGKAMVFKTLDDTSKIMMLDADIKIPSTVKEYLSGIYKIKVANKYNELLDVLVEGSNSNKTILFAHGLGTNKDEGLNLFKDIASHFSKDFRIVRFDFSAYGDSEGKEVESNIAKTAEDLGTMVTFIQDNFIGEYYLIAHSMGTYTTGKLNPDGFKKIVLIGVPNDEPKFSIDRLAERICSRKGGVLDFDGVSIYPRTSGDVQKVGPKYWEELRKYNVKKAMENLQEKTELTIIHPLQDEIIGNEYMDAYKTLKKAKYIEIDGDHSWSKPEERQKLLKLLESVFVN